MANILLVEDDLALGNAIKYKLEKQNHKVEWSIKGQKAIDILTAGKYKPDFVILDLLLPGVGGKEVLSQVRKLPEGAKIPVLVITNLEDDTLKKQIEYYHPVAYLKKTQVKLGELDGIIKSNLA